MRYKNRTAEELRPVSIEYDVQPHADASLLIKMGQTHVLCGVTVEEGVPPFLRETGQGWITAEYGMLPCATPGRFRREAVSGRVGRTYEIQRLIGRSLRMMVDLAALGEHTLRVDCDVISADGGTRCASITGGALAVRQVLIDMENSGRTAGPVTIMPVAAVSAGIVASRLMLDLDYSEDSRADVDANFVMSGDGNWIEIQITAEGTSFSSGQLRQLEELARQGISKLLALWPSDPG